MHKKKSIPTRDDFFGRWSVSNNRNRISHVSSNNIARHSAVPGDIYYKTSSDRPRDAMEINPRPPSAPPPTPSPPVLMNRLKVTYFTVFKLLRTISTSRHRMQRVIFFDLTRHDIQADRPGRRRVRHSSVKQNRGGERTRDEIRSPTIRFFNFDQIFRQTKHRSTTRGH